MPRSVRLRLLRLTVPVAILAVVAGAWAGRSGTPGTGELIGRLLLVTTLAAGLTAAATVVTARHIAPALNPMPASLDEADRLRRRLADDLAHELRTPLSNIRGYLEAVQDGIAPLNRQLVDSVHEDTLLLQALVGDLAELSTADPGRVHLRLAPTDVDELVATVVASRQGRARAAGVALEMVGATAGPVPVDGRRLRQVVANLLDNALGHTDAGDRVTVTAARVGEALELTLADTGTGIPAEHLPRLFDRFYRADPSRARTRGGTGLGLAISREIVAAHGGDITVSSQVGVGTTFVVRLPCPAPSARAARGGDPTPADFTSIDLG